MPFGRIEIFLLVFENALLRDDIWLMHVSRV